MTVRELVYGMLSTDPELISLGLGPDNTFANAAPDSPPESGLVWAVLKWGVEAPGIFAQRGRNRATFWNVDLWVYTRDDDYGVVNRILKRWRDLLDSQEALRTGAGSNDGWLISANWQGDGQDGWDDAYHANFRTCTYIIVASGD